MKNIIFTLMVVGVMTFVGCANPTNPIEQNAVILYNGNMIATFQVDWNEQNRSVEVTSMDVSTIRIIIDNDIDGMVFYRSEGNSIWKKELSPGEHTLVEFNDGVYIGELKFNILSGKTNIFSIKPTGSIIGATDWS